MSPLDATQLALRPTFLGASEISSVVGLNPFSKPIDVWLRKMGQAQEDESEEAEFRKMLGHRIEGLIADLYAEKTGATLETCDTIIHPEHEWIGCTPDRRIVGTERGLEIKNVGANVAHHWTRESPPDYVTCQAQWQAFVTGWQAIDIAALIGGRDFWTYTVQRDDEMIALMFDIARRFWNDYVLTKTPPPVDGSNSYREFLARRYPNSKGEMVRAPEDAKRWVEAYEAARVAESNGKASKQEAANHLQAIIADNAGIFGDGFKATWKQNEHGSRTLRVTLSKTGAKRARTIGMEDV